jgi:hypothetical protein
MSNAGGLRLEIIFLRAFEPAGLTNFKNTGIRRDRLLIGGFFIPHQFDNIVRILLAFLFANSFAKNIEKIGEG